MPATQKTKKLQRANPKPTRPRTARVKPTRLKKLARSRAMDATEKRRVACIVKAAVELMEGDKAAADEWMDTPVDLFRDKTPREHAKTKEGASEVRDLIGRIEHGVFS